MAQGIGTLGSLTVLGAQMTHVRGVDPSVCLIRLVPDVTFDRFVDDLTLTYGGISLTATDVAVAAVPGRWHLDREHYRWNAVALDRRWKWRYTRISGKYNVRRCDGSIDPETQKSARQLGQILFDELGEAGYDVSDLPSTAYPAVLWDNALARLELQWLCDLFAADVCMTLSDTFSIQAITTTASLPAGGTPVTPETYSHKPAVMPSKVRIAGSDLIKQDWISLTPVGLDWNGNIEPLTSLSYAPAGGWGNQWPYAFPDVATQYRHLAFETVWRWFIPPDNIVLLNHPAESGLDTTRNQKFCLPPQVRGDFFMLDDLGTNGSDEYSSAVFRIREDLNLVEFEYPVYALSSGTIVNPSLEINTGYIEVDATGVSTQSYSYDQNIPEAKKVTDPRVLRHPELLWHDITASIYGSATGTNTAALDAEATVYAEAVANSYSYDKAQDIIYDGILAIDLTGSITQIRWTVGNDWPAFTRVGVNTEFDVREKQRQQRRAHQRLLQMAERMAL